MKEKVMRKGIMLIVAAVVFVAVSSFNSNLKSEECPFEIAVYKPCNSGYPAYQATACEGRADEQCDTTLVLADTPDGCQYNTDDAHGPNECVDASTTQLLKCFTAQECIYNSITSSCSSFGQLSTVFITITLKITRQCFSPVVDRSQEFQIPTP
jgi:hypothetical protein